MGRAFAHDWYLHAVVNTINEARRIHSFIGVGDLLNALRRSQTDAYDEPSASHARRLAEGLRSVLTLEELVGLSEMVRRDLDNSSQTTTWRLKEAAGKAAESLRRDERCTTRIADLPLEQAGPHQAGVIAFAVILQALQWAIQPPEPQTSIAIP